MKLSKLLSGIIKSARVESVNGSHRISFSVDVDSDLHLTKVINLMKSAEVLGASIHRVVKAVDELEALKKNDVVTKQREDRND